MGLGLANNKAIRAICFTTRSKHRVSDTISNCITHSDPHSYYAS